MNTTDVSPSGSCAGSATVYRVQDKDGRGPWRPGFSQLWVEGRDDHDNLPPWFAEFGRVDQRGIIGMAKSSACMTLDQLRRWFTPSEYATLRKHGYHAVRMQVGRVLAESAVQCFFERAKALHLDAEPIDLY
jgi:hypothetical protein